MSAIEHRVDVDELVDILRTVGGGVSVSEITYQLARRGHPAARAAVIDALCAAEARGLVTPWAWTLGPDADERTR